MKKVWTGATFAIALGCAVTLSAQAGSSSGQTTSGSQGSSRTVTVTGCLQGSGGTAGATGSAGSSGSSGAAQTCTGSAEWPTFAA